MKFQYKALIIVGLFLLVVYIPYRFTYAWYADPSSCSKCHESEPYATSWKKSPRKDINCMACHETRGPFHRLDTTIRGIRDVGIHIRGDYSFLRNLSITIPIELTVT